MDATQVLKSYYLKVALPIVLITLLCDNIFSKGSFLNSKLSQVVLAGSGARFLHERGGNREDSKRGQAYFDQLNVKIYEGDAAKNLALKDFMINHVTSFEPAIFLELAAEWPAIQKWNLEAEGDATLSQGFGEELVQVLNYTASAYSYYWKSTEIEYREMGDTLKSMLDQRDYSKIYKSRSQRQTGSGQGKLVVVDQEIPESLSADIMAPKVTEQLLDLNFTTMDVLGKGSKDVATRVTSDLLTCVVSGTLEVALVSGWEYLVMRVGHEFSNRGYLPTHFSPVDLFDEAFRDAKVHLVTLGAGDCLYAPSHWWLQRAGAAEQRTLVVNHWYNSSSSWSDLILDGVSKGKL